MWNWTKISTWWIIYLWVNLRHNSPPSCYLFFSMKDIHQIPPVFTSTCNYTSRLTFCVNVWIRRVIQGARSSVTMTLFGQVQTVKMYLLVVSEQLDLHCSKPEKMIYPRFFLLLELFQWLNGLSSRREQILVFRAQLDAWMFS